MLREDRIDALHRAVCKLTLKKLIELNPTLDELRAVEYVRDIGHGHYPHYSDYQLNVVEKLLRKYK